MAYDRRVADTKQAEKIVSKVVARLKEEREAQGMSKRQLAIRANVDPKTVSFVENEERNPTLYTLLKFAGALDIDLGSIISNAGSKKEGGK